jgi:hypothetical protein
VMALPSLAMVGASSLAPSTKGAVRRSTQLRRPDALPAALAALGRGVVWRCVVWCGVVWCEKGGESKQP